LAPPPSGEQFEIRFGEHRATVVEVGGGVREYLVGDRPVLDPYPRDAICDGAHGAPLIPWPNRLADGRYSFDGVEHQLALTEPERHNAIHGLLRWRNWAAVERSADRVVMGIRLHPMTGWPFPLELSISYTVGEDGLTVETRARNLGRTACPFGSGQHSYLSPGEGLLDDCTLEAAGSVRIVVDQDRELPVGREPVEGSEYDLSRPRRIGSLQIDHAFCELRRDTAGLAWVRLTGSDGRTASLWCDQSYPLLQLYTGDTLAEPRRRRGLGAEPMTCPPNALQSGEGIVRLEPGETHASRWGVGLDLDLD
jgi:aldose 1-epimerase